MSLSSNEYTDRNFKLDFKNFVIDKVQTVYHGYIKCPVCGFDNSEILHECPVCNFELIGKTITLCDEV